MYADDLALAHDLADAADAIALARFRALGLRWWAAKGAGAYAGASADAGTRISVSRVGDLSDASFCYADLNFWDAAGRLDAILDVIRRTWRNRAYGDFWAYMLLAEGTV